MISSPRGHPVKFMLIRGSEKKKNSYVISDISGFGKKNISSCGVLENGQNHQLCPQGTELAVPSLCCLSQWPPGHQASLCRQPPQGHGQPGLDLTSSSLAAGDVYAHAEATKVSAALFPWNRELAGGHLNTRGSWWGRHCCKTGGGCLAKDRACLGESLSGGILPAIPNVAFPNKSTSSSWTNKYLSAKRLILGEGTEGFFQSTLQGKLGCYDRHLHLLNNLSELFGIISSFN